MKGNWKDLFSFNKRERNGIFVLSTLIILVIGIQVAMPYFISDEVVIDVSAMDAYVAQLKLDSAEWVTQNKNKYRKKPKSTYKRKSAQHSKEHDEHYLKKPTMNYSNSDKSKTTLWEPHDFDPNNASEKDWKSVGLNKGQIKSINKYLDKGGEFRKKRDVAKMYVINELQYSKMEEYLLLPDTILKRETRYPKDTLYAASIKTKYPKKKNYNYDTITIELNSADTTSLKRLRGIGSYYARQIIYQREKLGGFHSVSQLYEIERMREETVLKIIPFLTVDTNLIQKIHINTDLAPDMVKHPYITWNMAIQIQDYRDFSHKFKSVRDLVKNGLLNEELYLKLAPYLEL